MADLISESLSCMGRYMKMMMKLIVFDGCANCDLFKMSSVRSYFPASDISHNTNCAEEMRGWM
jgi:hypothetical protein